jgi:hypothetical protein
MISRLVQRRVRPWIWSWFVFLMFFSMGSIAQGQTDTPEITLGLTHFDEETRIGTRELYFRPHAEVSDKNNRFYPTAAELVDGDGATIFLRMNSEASSRLRSLRQISQNDYEEKRLEDLPAPEIRQLMCINRDEMKRFVYRSRAGWNYPLQEQPWQDILLPDAQESRTYVRAMIAFSRASIIEGDIPQAEEWIRYSLGMARHVRETPFMVTRLVSVAEAGMAVDTIEELLQHPDASNYYWDLTNIPRPFVDMTETSQFESQMWLRTIPELVRLEELKSKEDWSDLAGRVFSRLRYLQDKIPEWESPEGEDLWNGWTKTARERLHRIAPELVPRMKGMSDDEIGVRYLLKRIRQFESVENTMSLEQHLALPRANAIVRDLKLSLEDEPFLKLCLEWSYWPTGLAYFVELDQRIAMLRIIESIRDWSANHGGGLPASLSVLDLPVPLDVATQQPFEWVLSEDGRVGELSGAVIERIHFNHDDPALAGRRYRLVLPDEASDKE